MGRYRRGYNHLKIFMCGYSVCVCNKCTMKCHKEILYKEKEGIKYIPIGNIMKFSEIMNIGSVLWFWIKSEVDTLEDLVELKEHSLLYTISEIIKNYKVDTFCYLSISHVLLQYLKDNPKKINLQKLCHEDHVIIGYIINILWLFFGDPAKKDNKLKMLWMDHIKEQINEEFLNMDVDDRYSRCKEIHNKTKKFKIEYYGQCQLCGKDIDDTLYLSHIKAWKRCHTKKEKRDIDDTLLLCHDHDRLFDKGYISFGDNGNIILSDELLDYQIIRYELEKYTKIDLNKNQLPYMEYHRRNAFRK